MALIWHAQKSGAVVYARVRAVTIPYPSTLFPTILEVDKGPFLEGAVNYHSGVPNVYSLYVYAYDPPPPRQKTGSVPCGFS